MVTKITMQIVKKKDVTVNFPFPISDLAASRIEAILEGERNSKAIYDEMYDRIHRIQRIKNVFDIKINSIKKRHIWSCVCGFMTVPGYCKYCRTDATKIIF